MTTYTDPLFDAVEDDESDSDSCPSSPHGGVQGVSSHTSCSMIAPVMMTHALTLEKQLAQIKIICEELKKENEEKNKQIDSLTKKLEEHPESSKHNNTTSKDGAATRSDENDNERKSNSFIVKDVYDMISNAIKMQFGETPQGSYHYINPYTKRVDRLEMPLGYKVPTFQLFDGKGNPKQHIAHFVETCSNAGTKGDLLASETIRSQPKENCV
ncbi:hypothetical protein RND81_07G090200 [Saponaria officinalis]|uniref:Ty3-gypsy retrotransposon protein n=1 Tax=Saponaria officinalis TaxID=3572 RepID=A0AAW1JLE8_SAPOF